MDFSDQIALGGPARGRAARRSGRSSARSTASCCSTSTRTPRSPRRRCCRGCSPGRTRDRPWHAVTAVGDPNQAIYGWRGASVSNILRFGRRLPERRPARRRPDVPAHGEPPLRPPHPRRRQPPRASRCTTPSARCSRSSPRRDDAGEVPVAGPRDATPTSWSGWPSEVRAAHDSDVDRAWREIGVLTRDNAHAADVFDALTAREIPVEIVGLKGLLRLPEVAEVVATLTCSTTSPPTPSCSPCSPARGGPIGPRDLRAARPPGAQRWPAPARSRAARARSTRS